jgi:dsDNA-specific endonuclease/ATPase MutS2
VKANIAEMKAVTSKRTKQRTLVDSENSLEEKMEEYFNLVEKASREQNELERTLARLLGRIEKGTQPDKNVEPVSFVDNVEPVSSAGVVLPPAMRNEYNG